MNSVRPPAPDSGTPQQFGRYVVTALLGKGAMGEVFLAQDPVLDRKVALKVIALDAGLDQATREEYFARFSLEAKSSAKLNHPSIVSVYDAGEENERPWIAFQFVEGETLEKLLTRRGKLPVRRALAFALDIASALQHAHGWSIVHRDIKPANILIEASTGIAMLADFGIAKAPWTTGTREGDALGSPGYMSPEQLEGADLDERTDLFSLGVVIYQMVTGRNPFIRDTVTATAFATCKGDYAPLRDIVHDVPPALDRAVRKCLFADRRMRMASAGDLIAQLKSADQPDGSGVLSKNPPAGAGAAPAVRPAAGTPGTSGSSKTRREMILRFSEAGREVSRFFDVIFSGRKRRAGGRPGIGRSREPLKLFSLLSWRPGDLMRTVNRTPLSKALFWTALTGMFCIVLAAAIAASFSGPAAPAAGSPEATMSDLCAASLEADNRESANEAMKNLAAMNSSCPATHMLIARVLIRNGDFTTASRHLALITGLKSGKKELRHDLPSLLEELRRQLKRGPAAAELIELMLNNLDISRNRDVRDWTTDDDYWLRWNAVDICQTAGLKVDLVPAYIADLVLPGSAKVRVRAARKLGELGDRRAIDPLERVRARGQGDPLVSAEAAKVLAEKFR